jgi:hypothetical protein
MKTYRDPRFAGLLGDPITSIRKFFSVYSVGSSSPAMSGERAREPYPYDQIRSMNSPEDDGSQPKLD